MGWTLEGASVVIIALAATCGQASLVFVAHALHHQKSRVAAECGRSLLSIQHCPAAFRQAEGHPEWSHLFSQPILVLVAHALQQATRRVTKAVYGGPEACSTGPVSNFDMVAAGPHFGRHGALTALCGRQNGTGACLEIAREGLLGDMSLPVAAVSIL